MRGWSSVGTADVADRDVLRASKIGAPSAVRGVHLRGHGAEPVGVHEVLVLPRRRPGDCAWPPRARTMSTRSLVVEDVSVDVDVTELVVLLDPLQGLEVLLQDRGTPQPDVVDRGLVRRDLLGGHDGLEPGSRRRLDVVRLVSNARRVPSMLSSMYGCSRWSSCGFTRNRCTNAGYAAPSSTETSAEQDHGDDRERPTRTPDVHEEQHRADHRHDDQEVERRAAAR